MPTPEPELAQRVARLEGIVIEMRTELPYLKREIDGQFKAQREYMDQKFATLASAIQPGSSLKPNDLSKWEQWIGLGIGILVSNAIIIFALWASGAFG